jgi:hypothetical protein
MKTFHVLVLLLVLVLHSCTARQVKQTQTKDCENIHPSFLVAHDKSKTLGQSDKPDLDQLKKAIRSANEKCQGQDDQSIDCRCRFLLEHKLPKMTLEQMIIQWPLATTRSGSATDENGKSIHVPLGPVVEVVIEKTGEISSCQVKLPQTVVKEKEPAE